MLQLSRRDNRLRGRPAAGGQPIDADPLLLALIYPDTEAALTSTLLCARSQILGSC
ncbi:hypothetical protein AB0P37_39725 [Streptomyces antimycoticus]|uniref:hypothetical protein n=1 Tax=Streptomyces antimycoticus TaxID=68175 RepID=UPI00341A6BC8|nr:hypothetical protein OG546_50260 [Streptomyces antimycoticus]